VALAAHPCVPLSVAHAVSLHLAHW
jgi:hypothetical protein